MRACRPRWTPSRQRRHLLPAPRGSRAAAARAAAPHPAAAPAAPPPRRRGAAPPRPRAERPPPPGAPPPPPPAAPRPPLGPQLFCMGGHGPLHIPAMLKMGKERERYFVRVLPVYFIALLWVVTAVFYPGVTPGGEWFNDIMSARPNLPKPTIGLIMLAAMLFVDFSSKSSVAVIAFSTVLAAYAGNFALEMTGRNLQHIFDAKIVRQQVAVASKTPDKIRPREQFVSTRTTKTSTTNAASTAMARGFSRPKGTRPRRTHRRGRSARSGGRRRRTCHPFRRLSHRAGPRQASSDQRAGCLAATRG